MNPLLPSPTIFNPLENDSYTCDHCERFIPMSCLDGGPYEASGNEICFACWELFMEKE